MIAGRDYYLILRVPLLRVSERGCTSTFISLSSCLARISLLAFLASGLLQGFAQDVPYLRYAFLGSGLRAVGNCISRRRSVTREWTPGRVAFGAHFSAARRVAHSTPSRDFSTADTKHQQRMLSQFSNALSRCAVIRVIIVAYLVTESGYYVGTANASRARPPHLLQSRVEIRSEKIEEKAGRKKWKREWRRFASRRAGRPGRVRKSRLK